MSAMIASSVWSYSFQNSGQVCVSIVLLLGLTSFGLLSLYCQAQNAEA